MPTKEAAIQKLADDIQGAIDAGEAEIGKMHTMVHGAAGRVHALMSCRAALQNDPNDIELARIGAAISKLKTPVRIGA